MKKLSLFFVVALTTLSFSNSHCMDQDTKNKIAATIAVAASVYGIYYLYNNYYCSNKSAETKKPLTPLDVAEKLPRQRTLADYAADAQNKEMKQILQEAAKILPRQPLNDETQVAKASALIGEGNATKTPVTQNPTTTAAVLKQEPTKQPVKQSTDAQVQPSLFDTLSNSKPVKFLKEKYEHFKR